MDTQSLRAFLWVAETGSFSEAAETLHLTQPAVSKRVASLEDSLNVRLFDRINRRVSLTEAGRALLPRAQHILREVLDAKRALRDLDQNVMGPLKMATSHHVGLHRLPPVLKSYAAKYPLVSPDISFMDSEKAYEDIMSGKQEIAIVTLAPDAKTNLTTHKIWRDRLFFVCATDHPLAKKNNLTIADLAEEPAILPGDITYTGRIVQRLFEEHNTNLNVSMSTNYLETIKMLVSVGMGWSVLPESMCEGLYCQEMPSIKIERELGVIWHDSRTMSNAANAFINELSEIREEQYPCFAIA